MNEHITDNSDVSDDKEFESSDDENSTSNSSKKSPKTDHNDSETSCTIQTRSKTKKDVPDEESAGLKHRNKSSKKGDTTVDKNEDSLNTSAGSSKKELYPSTELAELKESYSESFRSKKSTKDSEYKLFEKIKSNKWFLIIFFGLLFLILCTIKYPSPPSGSDSANQYLQMQFKYLRGNFSGIDLNPIFASIRSNIESENPSYPSTVMIISSRRTKNTANCLAKRSASVFAQLIRKKLKCRVERVEILLGPSTTKKDLEENIHALAKTSCTILLRDVHNLNGKTAMILHAFMDNENAHYKNTMYVMTMEMEENLVDEGMEKPLKVAEEFLHEKWDKDIKRDNTAAISTRIATSVLFINSNIDMTCD